MLRYALRRILWSIPTLLGTSLVVFFVTTLAPSQAVLVGDATVSATAQRVAEARRARFSDLPRFLNRDPQDVRTRALKAVSLLAAGGEGTGVRAGARDGARMLRHMGGAALPVVIPLLDSLSPAARGRVAIALLPVAERMQLSIPADINQPEAAALFWTRFWDDRALDYSRPAVARAVTRLVDHGTDLRERDLVALDTFALADLIDAMTATRDPTTLARLTRLAHHAAERGPVIRDDATPEDARRKVSDWREWWFATSDDFVSLDGVRRISAVVTETRYGKWIARAMSGQLGISAISGDPIADELKARAPVTLLVCGLATALSWMLAVPIGAIGAWRRGKPLDIATSAVMFVLYAMPTFGLAELLRRIAGSHNVGGVRLALAV
ncbi:MAG: ABC transporter permease, partial [Polyangiaceae bacterium]